LDTAASEKNDVEKAPQNEKRKYKCMLITAWEENTKRVSLSLHTFRKYACESVPAIRLVFSVSEEQSFCSRPNVYLHQSLKKYHRTDSRKTRYYRQRRSTQTGTRENILQRFNPLAWTQRNTPAKVAQSKIVV
jgi:hypothetical protein